MLQSLYGVNTPQYVANRHQAMADIIARTKFTQSLAGNGRLPQLQHSGF
jgi:hypothetical protein